MSYREPGHPVQPGPLVEGARARRRQDGHDEVEVLERELHGEDGEPEQRVREARGGRGTTARDPRPRERNDAHGSTTLSQPNPYLRSSLRCPGTPPRSVATSLREPCRAGAPCKNDNWGPVKSQFYAPIMNQPLFALII